MTDVTNSYDWYPDPDDPLYGTSKEAGKRRADLMALRARRAEWLVSRADTVRQLQDENDIIRQVETEMADLVVMGRFS